MEDIIKLSKVLRKWFEEMDRRLKDTVKSVNKVVMQQSLVWTSQFGS